MGGFSSEWQISMNSGAVVYKHLNKELYNCYQIKIDSDRWFVFDEDREYNVDKNDFSCNIDGKIIKFDAVFNAIHGTPGEDGKLQAYLEMMGVPQTSCDFFEAALTFNKRECLAVARQYDIPTAKSVFVSRNIPYELDKVAAYVGFPCFVKPNRAGSSFGISKVYRIEDMPKALEIAFEEDSEVLVEAFLDGREVSVGVIQWEGQTKVLPITEIVAHNDFFDYKAKYEGQSEEITPADLPADMQSDIVELAAKVYESLNLKGLSRSEFILVNNVPHLLEVNTTPGLSEQSILPQQCAAAGISLEALFGQLIENCIAG